MTRSGAIGGNEETVIILCESCSQKLRLPKRNKKLRVTCPNCRHEFEYHRRVFGLQPASKKHLVAGLIGGLLGAATVEILGAQFLFSIQNPLVSTSLVTALFGLFLGAAISAADGYIRRDRQRLFYGLKVGAVLGLISGALSGFIAQLVFGAILSPSAPLADPSIALVMFARTIGWCLLGLLIGIAYGIKENTSGDLKSGMIGGALGGAVGGLLFDPLSSMIQLGDGALGRIVGFSTLGIAIGLSINRLREIAISKNRADMYRPLSRRLPANPRLLPGSGGTSPAAGEGVN